MAMMRHAGLLLLLAALTGLGGCAAYVNIPAQAADAASHNVNNEYVVHALAEATAAVVADMQVTKPYLVMLPKGATAQTYKTVLAAAGDHATAPEILPAEEPAGATTAPAAATAPAPFEPGDRAVIDVAQVRIRAWKAQVDFVRPMSMEAPQGQRQAVTVYLKWDPVSHWQVIEVRVWREAVETALRKSAYSPEPEMSR